MRTWQSSRLLRVTTAACGIVLFMLVCLATGVSGSLAKNQHHQTEENAQAAQAASIKKKQVACFRRCDEQRENCEVGLVVVIVSRAYDCSQGRIKCQGYCDSLAK